MDLYRLAPVNLLFQQKNPKIGPFWTKIYQALPASQSYNCHKRSITIPNGQLNCF